MILMNKKIQLISLIVLLLFNFNARAEELGRLFTTPKERLMLEKLRNAKPVSEAVVVKSAEPVDEYFEEEFVEEEFVEDEPQPGLEGPLSLKGVVYRETGSNTAWINEDNTYDGNLNSKNIDVRNRDIQKDEVKVQIPGDVTEITLKVGETYEPTPESPPEVYDN